MKFGKLILGKIIEIAATRCHILKLKCTNFDLSWGSVPDPTGRAYSAHPNPYLEIRGLLLREGRMRRNGKGGRGEWRVGEGR